MLHEGEAMVADFGIALAVRNSAGERLTASGLSVGTPQYMSPEQATGERELTARSDLFSLGVVVYEMLTGDPPFRGSTSQAVVARLMTERPAGIRTVRDTVPAGSRPRCSGRWRRYRRTASRAAMRSRRRCVRG